MTGSATTGLAVQTSTHVTGATVKRVVRAIPPIRPCWRLRCDVGHTCPVHVEVRSGLGAIAHEWDDLAAAQPLPSPFLLSWWVDNAAADSPRIVCCFDGDRLVGGAAFEVGAIGPGPLTIERVRFLGQGVLSPDHLDVIAAPGRRAEVVRAVVDWLRRGNRIIDLDGLSGASELGSALGARVLSETAAPYLELKDGADPIAALPGRLRSTISRTAKRLDKAGYRSRRVDPDDSERALAALAELHGSRWVEDSGFIGGWEPFRAAAAAGMRSGAVVVHEIADEGGAVIATEVELVAGDRVAFYQAGRLTDHEYRGSGSALKADVVRWAASTGHTEFDFLRGAEGYKDDWATSSRWVRRVRVGVGPWGRPSAAAADATHRLAPAALGLVARAFGQERADALTQRINRTVGR